jgi:hypothetical protein
MEPPKVSAGVGPRRLNAPSTRDPKQTSERLQAIIAESKRVARQTEALIDLTHKLSEADARLARALSEVGADLSGVAPRVRRAKRAAWRR